MAKKLELDPNYDIHDKGLHTDRPHYQHVDTNGHHTTYISSPYFRDLYYTWGYNDYLTKTWRQHKGGHPDNAAAYEMGQRDAEGDTYAPTIKPT